MADLIDKTGQRFGRLLVLEQAASSPVRWKCRCDCGNIAVIPSSTLGRYANSCGCIRREVTRRRCLTHGYTANRQLPREFVSWWHAKDRCYNPADKAFPAYGARGITMCDRWRTDFGAFRQDMGPCPTGFSLDRIDNDGPYAPDNCRWASPRTQSNNTRRNRWLMVKGERMTATQAARRYAVNIKTVNTRLGRGWSPEDAVLGRRSH